MVKQLLATLCVGLLVGAALTYWLYPRVEYRQVVKQETVVRNDVRTVIKTVERPDGTRETVQETTDNTVRADNRTATTEKVLAKNWLVAATAAAQLKNLEPVYGLHVQRRILGPFFVGALANSTGQLGLSLGMEF